MIVILKKTPFTLKMHCAKDYWVIQHIYNLKIKLSFNHFGIYSIYIYYIQLSMINVDTQFCYLIY